MTRDGRWDEIKNLVLTPEEARTAWVYAMQLVAYSPEQIVQESRQCLLAALDILGTGAFPEDRVLDAALTAMEAQQAKGRPRDSACRCVVWPCPCACHVKKEA